MPENVSLADSEEYVCKAIDKIQTYVRCTHWT